MMTLLLKKRLLVAVLAVTLALSGLPLFSHIASASTLGDLVADRAEQFVGSHY
jgi:hypothetical protein